MSRPVVTGPEAENDINQINRYYKKIDATLPYRFLDELNHCILTLYDNPDAFPVIYKSYRRTLLDQFPYAVFYSIEATQIRIMTVFIKNGISISY